MLLLSPLPQIFDQRAESCWIVVYTTKCNIAPATEKITGFICRVIVIGMEYAIRQFATRGAFSGLRDLFFSVFRRRESSLRLARTIRVCLATGAAKLHAWIRSVCLAGNALASGKNRVACALRSIDASLTRFMPSRAFTAALASASFAVLLTLAVGLLSAGGAQLEPIGAWMTAAAESESRVAVSICAIPASSATVPPMDRFLLSAAAADRHGSQHITNPIGWEPRKGAVLTYWIEEG